MNCPSCGQWNPEDKRVCWRCQTPLPRPVEKSKRPVRVFMGLPVWTWVVVSLLFLGLIVAQCVGPGLLRGS